MTDAARLTQGFADRAFAPAEGSRVISWIFSNEAVALDFHTIKTAGWELDDYLRNPVLLFAHNQEAPPIGRTTRIETRGPLLVGDTEFASAEDYPFADTIFRLVKGGFLNAVSVSWFPLDFKPAKDRARPEGIDFLRQKLLEISVVPVPANPAALATARAMGIDIAPLNEWAQRVLDSGAPLVLPRRQLETVERETRMPTPRSVSQSWKCCASRSLPVKAAAGGDAEALFALCKFDGAKPDLGKLRKAFLIVDDARPRDRASYRHPIATVVEGRLYVSGDLLRAARADLAAADYPETVAMQARDALALYEAKMTKPVTITKRGLYEVSSLAYLLSQVGYIKSGVDYEEAAEGDEDSTSPANMLAVLQAMGKALIEMTQEEVSELIAKFGPLDAGERALRAKPMTAEEVERFKREWAKGAGAGKILALPPGGFARAQLNKSDKADLESVHEHCARSARLMRTHIDHYQDEDLSDDDTRDAMLDNAEAVHDHCVRSAQMLRDHIDGRAPEEESPAPAKEAKTDDGDEKRSAELRRAEAARLRAKSLIES